MLALMGEEEPELEALPEGEEEPELEALPEGEEELTEEELEVEKLEEYMVKNKIKPTDALRGWFNKYLQEKQDAGEIEEEIDEDIFIKKLSPEARARLKAKDKMTTAVIDFAKDKPSNASKLIHTWITK
jgi:flagellar biosynthesis/type III secretory pathway M-ring protein FliF/YscJ